MFKKCFLQDVRHNLREIFFPDKRKDLFMKSDNYKITQYSVSSILNYVENSQIAIPEIQRPFVWKGEEVRALIDSLYEGYPIGYLIV